MVNNFHKAKTQDHLGNHQAIRKVAEKSVTSLDHRKSGVLPSAVEQQDAPRGNKVKKLIEKFENHKHKESFLQDLSQTQKINKFSRESQDLIADLNSTEIFELFENSSKQQCLDCNAYWEMGIIYYSCGRSMKSSQSSTEFDQNNTSILGYVVKKNSSSGAKHGPSERQRMYCQAKQMLKKARQRKHERHPRILSRREFVVCHRVERNTLCCTTESPWRRTSTSPQKLKEFKIRSIGFPR